MSVLSRGSVACLSGNNGKAIVPDTEKKLIVKEEVMAQQVRIDQEECLGCEACVEICPAVFAFNEAIAKAFVKSEASGEEECVEEAIASCPAGCISKD